MFKWNDQIEKSFTDRVELLSREAYHTATVLGATLFPAFSLVDFFTHRELFWPLTACRSIASVVFFLAYLGSRKRKYPGSEFLSGLSILVVASASITAMCLLLTGYESPYYAGVNLVVLAAGLLFPWNVLRMSIAISVIIGIWLTAVLFHCHFHISHADVFINNLAFLLATGTIGIAAARLGDRLRRNSFAWIESEKTVSMQDEFISIASHELRTPLTALLMQVEILRRQSPNESKSAEKFERLVKRMATLVEQMLDLSRVQSNKLLLSQSETHLSRLVEDAVDGLSHNIAEAGIVLNQEIRAKGPGFWDAVRVEQVVTNLLTNAIKYGEKKPITVVVEEQDGMAVLKVIDQGPGIPPEEHDRVFQRFERFTHDRKISGLGLGLYIAKGIVTAHNGTIEVQSELGKGSSFIVKLPLDL